MYINDINILYYVLIGIIGLIVGQFLDWCNQRLPQYKEIFSKEFFTIFLKNFKPKYILMFGMAIIYILLLYFIGWKDGLLNKIELLKYIILAPMLICTLTIDIKHQIIPNRLNLAIFEVGLACTFMQGIMDMNVAINTLLGGVIGAGVFLAITAVGGLIVGKEAMGFGDVKLMGGLGLFFGWINIIIIALIAFLLGAIVSIFLLITKKKKTNEYIPFGPFIVVAAFIVMVVPNQVLITLLFKIFTLGMYNI